MITNLKNRIMFGVYVMYFVRKLKTPYSKSLFTAGLFVVSLSFLVSIPDIIANIILTQGSYSFMSDAILGADILVQSILAIFCLFILLHLKSVRSYTIDAIRNRFA